MAKIYAELIRKGKKTIDDVPDNLKQAVKTILNSCKQKCIGWLPLVDYSLYRVYNLLSL